MTEKDIICIHCPKGCRVSIDFSENENDKVINSITGYGCKKGLEYVQEEIRNPSRIITTTVKVINGDLSLLPVKTEKGIPKELIFSAMNEIRNIEVEAPVKVGQIIRNNLLNTGIDIIATRDIKRGSNAIQ